MDMVERSFFTVTNAAGETISVLAIRQGRCIGFDLPSGASGRFTVKDLLNATHPTSPRATRLLDRAGG